MTHLSEHLMEALKTTKSIRGNKIESYNYDVIQIVDRNFKEGISDEDFKKFIRHDIDEAFKLKEAQLGKGMDKVVDELIAKAMDRKMPEITRLAEQKYKRQSMRDKYIEDAKEEIRQRILKEHPVREIESVDVNLNPISYYDPRIFIYKGRKEGWGRSYTWGDQAINDMLEEFDVYFRFFDNGEEVKLRNGVIGWTITYAAYNGTKCPQSGVAHLELKLNKATDELVKRENKSHDDALAAYYAEKGSGGYTGD